MKSKLIFALIFATIGVHNIFSSFVFQTELISTVCFYSGILGILIGAASFHSAFKGAK